MVRKETVEWNRSTDWNTNNIVPCDIAWMVKLLKIWTVFICPADKFSI